MARARMLLGVGVTFSYVLAGCGTPQPPNGRLACKTASDCPSSWFCRPNPKGEKRCYRDDGSNVRDAGANDASARMDAAASGGGKDAATKPTGDAMAMKSMDAATADAGHDSGMAKTDAANPISDATSPMPDATNPTPDSGNPPDAHSDTGPSCNGIVSAQCMTLDPPRAIAPVSTGYVTSPTPLFRYVLAADTDGARVEICRDRACGNVVTHFDLQGTSGSPASALPTGVLYFRLYSMASGALASPPGPVWEFTLGPGLSSSVASSYGSLLDINGDGLGDLAVGAPDAPLSGTSMSDYQPGPGSAYVFLGDKNAKTSWKTSTPSPQITLRDPATANGDLYGTEVVSAGDLDGDGFCDLAIGAPCAPKASGSCGAGRVQVHRGSAAGLAENVTLASPGGNGGGFGVTITAGDLDGDGYSDLVVGADSAATVYIYRGSADFFTLSTHSPAWTLTQADRFGASLANVGDVNGDGFADLLIGSPAANGGYGAAYYVYGGSSNGFSGGHTPAKVAFMAPVASQASNAAFGTSVAGAGDVNGDGYTDALVGAPGGDTGGSTLDGVAYLYFGSATGFNTASPTLLTSSASYGSEAFGATVGGAGDVDGDGHADIVVGATSFSPTPTTSAAGRALFMSGPAPVTSTALVLGSAETSKASQFGSVLKVATDLNGDGYADLVIGTPRYFDTVPPYNSAGAARGKLSIWFGSSSSIVTMSDVTIDGPDGIGGRFGF